MRTVLLLKIINQSWNYATNYISFSLRGLITVEYKKFHIDEFLLSRELRQCANGKQRKSSIHSCASPEASLDTLQVQIWRFRNIMTHPSQSFYSCYIYHLELHFFSLEMTLIFSPNSIIHFNWSGAVVEKIYVVTAYVETQ